MPEVNFVNIVNVVRREGKRASWGLKVWRKRRNYKTNCHNSLCCNVEGRVGSLGNVSSCGKTSS